MCLYKHTNSLRNEVINRSCFPVIYETKRGLTDCCVRQSGIWTSRVSLQAFVPWFYKSEFLKAIEFIVGRVVHFLNAKTKQALHFDVVAADVIIKTFYLEVLCECEAIATALCDKNVCGSVHSAVPSLGGASLFWTQDAWKALH